MGVKVGVGLGVTVMVGEGVMVGDGVMVGEGVMVGPSNCPGAQADKARLKIKTRNPRVRWFVCIVPPIRNKDDNIKFI